MLSPYSSAVASILQSVRKAVQICIAFTQNEPPIPTYLLDARSHLLFDGFWSFLKPSRICLGSAHTCLFPHFPNDWNSTICGLCTRESLFIFRLTSTLYAYWTRNVYVCVTHWICLSWVLCTVITITITILNTQPVLSFRPFHRFQTSNLLRTVLPTKWCIFLINMLLAIVALKQFFTNSAQH